MQCNRSGIRTCGKYVRFALGMNGNAHLFAGMCSLGEDASFELVRPILQNCSADALLRFEQATPVSTPPLSAKPYLISINIGHCSLWHMIRLASLCLSYINYTF